METRRRGSCAWGALLAAIVICIEEGSALIEPSNICQDEISTDVLFAAGAFHSCGALGKTLGSTQGPNEYRRTVKCWGWGDFGQLDPPDIDHVTSLTAGARHSCATNRARVAQCWGSNLYGQGDLPRALPGMQKRYCKLGDYQADPNSRIFGMCEDKVSQADEFPWS